MADMPVSRGGALAEVLLCSGLPTQLLLTRLFASVGVVPFGDGGSLTIQYVVALTLADSVLLTLLILWLLAVHRESPRAIFIGGRYPGREARLGLFFVPVAGLLVAATLAPILRFAPWLHDVTVNPLEALIETRSDAVVLGLVAIVGGGVREEIQRAFVLHRFRQRLGGAVVGLLVFSSAFGAGHLIQGMDVAVTTGVLGLFWGVMYLWRGSIVAPMVCHAGFNAAEIIRYALVEI